jgi:N-acyl-D-aspartate/D-glutamate deacylase
MRWDWESFPELLDKVERGKLGVNAATLTIRGCTRTRWAMMRRDPKYKATGLNIVAIPARGCGIYSE